MAVGSRDALHSLEKVLGIVGGSDSVFLSKLRRRMTEVQLPVTNVPWLQLSWLNGIEETPRAQEDEEGHDYLSELDLNPGLVFELEDDCSCDQFVDPMLNGSQLLNDQLFEYTDITDGRGWDSIGGVDLTSGAIST